MDNQNFQYKQELDVFLSLCPHSILQNFIRKGSLPFFDYVKNVKMLKALGFAELCEVYILTDHLDMRDKARIIIDKNIQSTEHDEKPVVKEFITNIYSPGLRSMFLDRVNDYYNTTSFT